MNKEEIRHFKSLLKQGSLRHMNILLNDKFQSELLDIIKDYERLIKENQTLKEELEDMTLCRDIASGHRQEVQDRETLLLRYQERFIKYLQEEINVQIQEESIGCETTNKRYILEEILQKYKEIIGVR